MAHGMDDHPPSSILHPRLAPLVLAGPTAVGKSEIALRLAEQIGGEIISVDSMQVYRGMDIGTAKPSPADRARVPHHLLDVLDLTQAFDAAQFVHLAHQAVADIQSRGRVPILCGGTGLYFKAFQAGLGKMPAADSALRAVLTSTPLPDLLRELADRDRATYERIDRQNPRRVIRAVEVIRLTGKPFSAQRTPWQPPSPAPAASSLCFGFTRPTADLHQRIEIRIDAMFQRGWVAETEHLLERGLAENQTAMQALGYRQIVEHLRGVRSLTETIDLVKRRTRQFARRQRTWFRRQLPLTWITLEPQTDLESTVRAILKQAAWPDNAGTDGPR
jgi:tRNA dimethylallyltransferase